MASQGPLSPSSVVHVAGPDSDWETPENAVSSNNLYANVFLAVPAAISDLLRATSFGFDIPTGATIDGVLLEMEVNSEQAVVCEHELYLVKAGVRAGDNRFVGPAPGLWPAADAYLTRGGAADLWGASLSVADVEDSGFGVELAVTNHDEFSDKTAQVDHIRMTVYYTVAAGPGPTLRLTRSNLTLG
ncbi:MAG: hypothetical protein M3540_11495 [Actinomycetota bacterium]|nr:hypothetical protein [Actinomycetota bacterium]